MKKTLSIIIPCYNEEKRLSTTWNSLEKALTMLSHVDVSVVCVDDWSTDNTREILHSLQKISKIPLHIVSYDTNAWKWYAVKQWIFNSSSNYYLIMDADGATHMKAISLFLQKMNSVDMVIGSRETVLAKRVWYKKILWQASHLLISTVLWLWVKDTQCGFKMFSDRVKYLWNDVTLNRRWYDFEALYLMKQADATIEEVAVDWQEMNWSKVQWVDYIKTLWELFQVWKTHTLPHISWSHVLRQWAQFWIASLVTIMLWINVYADTSSWSDGGGTSYWTSYNVSTTQKQPVRRPVSQDRIFTAYTGEEFVAAQGTYFTAYDMSADGRYVAYTMCPRDTQRQWVYVKDMNTNIVTLLHSTTWCDANLHTTLKISSDGSRVAYKIGTNIIIENIQDWTENLLNVMVSQNYWKISSDMNIVLYLSGDNGNPLYVYDRNTDISSLVSSYSSFHDMSSDGKYVAFISSQNDLVVSDTNWVPDVFIKNLQSWVIQRINTKNDWSESLGSSYSLSISTNGRYVAFRSSSNDLVVWDTNNTTDIFVKDSQTWIIERVNTDSNGNQSNNDDWGSYRISWDGRYVVFQSNVTDLVSWSTNRNIFMKDRQTGIIRVIWDSYSRNQAPLMSEDLSKILFLAGVSYPVENTNYTTKNELVQYDINTNTYKDPTIEKRVQYYYDPNWSSWYPTISADGKYVAFLSDASNLVPWDINHERDVFLYDRENKTMTGVAIYAQWSARQPTISADSKNVVFNADFDLTNPTNLSIKSTKFSFGSTTSFLSKIFDATWSNIFDARWYVWASNNARYIAFYSKDSTLQSWTNFPNLYVKDTTNNTIEWITINANWSSAYPVVVSADGRYVAFDNSASNLVAWDINNMQDVFIKDRQTNIIDIVSANVWWQQWNSLSSFWDMTSDGRYVVFSSFSSNLLPGSANTNKSEIFVKDRQTGILEKVSVDVYWNESNASSFYPRISDNGRFVVFASRSSNLIAWRNTLTSYPWFIIYVKDRQTGLVIRADQRPNWVEWNQWAEWNADISADGRYVTFASKSTNLIDSDNNNISDIYIATLAIMWDGVVEWGEDCDDGNIVSSDGCSKLWEIETPTCTISVNQTNWQISVNWTASNGWLFTSIYWGINGSLTSLWNISTLNAWYVYSEAGTYTLVANVVNWLSGNVVGSCAKIVSLTPITTNGNWWFGWWITTNSFSTSTTNSSSSTPSKPISTTTTTTTTTTPSQSPQTTTVEKRDWWNNTPVEVQVIKWWDNKTDTVFIPSNIPVSSPTVAIQSAQTYGNLVWAGESAVVPLTLNPVLNTEKKCYNPKNTATITLWTDTKQKDLLIYQWLLKSYWLTKYDNTDTYRPDSGLRRNEAAKMFVEFAKNVLCREAKITYTNQYTDITNADSTLVPYIKQAYEFGILKGNNGLFRPTDVITKKEFVAALIRMFIDENIDVYGAGNERDREYKVLFNTLELDTQLSIWESIERYDTSKLFYKLYYNNDYVYWKDGYYIPLDAIKK
jgi:cysteine-rich repeat protein